MCDRLHYSTVNLADFLCLRQLFLLFFMPSSQHIYALNGGDEMKRRKSKHIYKKSVSGLPPVINGVFAGAALTMLLIILLAVMLRYSVVSENSITIANQIIKVLGIAVAAFMSARKECTHPWFRGLISGLLYIILGFIVFSAIVGSISFTGSNLADIIMGMGIGAVIGAIFGKRNK